MQEHKPKSHSVVELKRSTSVMHILDWEAGEEVQFDNARQSSFQLFAEGVAIGKLSSLSQSGCKIGIVCNFCLRAYENGERLGVLDGLFGIALLSYAYKCVDMNGKDFRKELLQFLWRKAQSKNGVGGNGKQLYFLSRDPDNPVPRCLDLSGFRFPDRRHFVDRLVEATESISGSQEFGRSFTEGGAMTFLFESSINAFEHGRHDRGKLIPGIRGILVEKLVFASKEQLGTHHAVPGMLENYLKGNLTSKKMVVCISVNDLGVGIQNSLNNSSQLDEWERFLHAFEAGVSRKTSSADLSWGKGLPRMLAAAKKLGAFLFIASAGVIATRDFSTTTRSSKEFLERIDCKPKGPRAGTSVSLLWPVSEETRDQLLFDFE